MTATVAWTSGCSPSSTWRPVPEAAAAEAATRAKKAPKTPASPGPGKWMYKTPTTQSPRALDYQEQVTGQPAWRVYQVGGTEFDGFTGKLLEAKGGVTKTS